MSSSTSVARVRTHFLPRLTAAAFAAFIGVLLVDTASAQEEPDTKWGEVPTEVALMKEFPPDTNAAAIILFDVGKLKWDESYNLTFTRHRRIKILKESGYDWGTFALLYLRASKAQKITDFDAHTLVPQPDGSVEEVDLPKDAVFDEVVTKGWMRKRATLPALAPGVIVEYRYSVRTRSPYSINYVPEWYFQTTEPTIWSDFRFEVPNTLSFTFATYANRDFDIFETNKVVNTRGGGKEQRWAVKRVPALREEPFMKAPDDFRMHVSAQFAGYMQPGHGFVSYVKSWQEFADELLDYRELNYTKVESSIKKQAAELTATAASDTEKLKLLYDFVRKNIEWNHVEDWDPEKMPSQTLEERKGSSADVSMLLTTLLRGVDIEAYPLLMSTRSNGAITEQYPLMSEFNYMITVANVDGKLHYLDATGPKRPYNVLPVRALAGKGWLLSKSPRFVPVSAESIYQHTTNFVASLDEDGNVTGKMSSADAGFSAVVQRTYLDDKSAEDLIRSNVFDEIDDVEIADAEVENLEPTEADLITRATVTIPGRAQAAGDFMYVNPNLALNQNENPLTLPDRQFPVDLAYARDITFNLSLKIPEGYVVEELPEKRNRIIPLKGGRYTRYAEVVGDTVKIEQRFRLDRALYDVREYKNLQEFFDYAVAAKEDQLILRRKSEEEAAVEGGSDESN